MSDLINKLREYRYNFFLELGLFYFLPVITKLPPPCDSFFLRIRSYLRFSLGSYRAYVNRPNLKEIAINNFINTLEIDRRDAKKRLFSLMQLEVFAEKNSMLFDTCTVSELEKRFTVYGLEKLDEALKRGKGVIFATVHAGEAELFVLFLALKGYKMYGLYDSSILREATRNPLHKFAKLKDKKLTGRIGKLYAGRNRPSVFDALKENGIIGWMVDLPAASVKRRSIVSLFNTKLSVNTSAWEVAKKTDASLLPFVDIYDPGNERHEVFIGDEIDLGEMVFQDLFTFYETHLKKSPESWGGWYILDLLKIKTNKNNDTFF